MISKWRLTASADEVISHRDLGIVCLNAISLQSISDAFIPLRGKKEKCDLLICKYSATKNTPKLRTHIITKFSVDFLFVHQAVFLGQEEKFFKMGGQQFFLCS